MKYIVTHDIPPYVKGQTLDSLPEDLEHSGAYVRVASPEVYPVTEAEPLETKHSDDEESV